MKRTKQYELISVQDAKKWNLIDSRRINERSSSHRPEGVLVNYVHENGEFYLSCRYFPRMDKTMIRIQKADNSGRMYRDNETRFFTKRLAK